MKRTVFVVLMTIMFALLSTSCAAKTPANVLDGYHKNVNAGLIGNALSYVASDAVFRIDAAPIAGVNGLFVGREEIRSWLIDIAASQGTADVYQMDLSENQLTCYLSYEDGILRDLGLNSIAMEEVSVVENGMIKSYTLTWLPSEKARFESAITAKYTDLRSIDPSDRKFFSPDYITQSETSLPFLHDITPADRKFYFPG